MIYCTYFFHELKQKHYVYELRNSMKTAQIRRTRIGLKHLTMAGVKDRMQKRQNQQKRQKSEKTEMTEK